MRGRSLYRALEWGVSVNMRGAVRDLAFVHRWPFRQPGCSVISLSRQRVSPRCPHRLLKEMTGSAFLVRLLLEINDEYRIT